MSITLLSCCVARPEAWTLLEHYMQRQTVKYDQWICVDDHEPRTIPTLGQEYYWKPEFKGPRSLPLKVKFAITENLIKGDILCFIEVDDYYAPNYLETLLARIRGLDITGEGHALYYNVKQRWWFEHSNDRYASLCATAVTRKVFPHLLRIIAMRKDQYLDGAIWQLGLRKKCWSGKGKKTVIGMKALPGTPGISNGHTGRDQAAKDDLDLSKLRSLIGDDALNYEPFWQNYVPPMPAFPLIGDSPFAKGHGPNWAKWLGHLRGQPAVGIEIGTFRGESAEWALDNIFTHPDSRLHCIDPFTGSAEHTARNIDCTTCESDTRARLARFGDRVTINKGYSHEFLRAFQGKVDSIYVDGDHSGRGVLRDAVLGLDLLKVGGVMIFDDYNWHDMPDPLDCPKQAIDAFLQLNSRQIEVLSPRGWQVAIRKKSE